METAVGSFKIALFKVYRDLTGIGLGGGQADPVNTYTTCPAAQAEDHAHWKLYPPSHPVTSSTSPMA